METITSPRQARERFVRLQARVLAEHGVEASDLELGRDTERPVHAIAAGRGPPLVFLHGGGDLAVTWAGLMARLQGRFRCLSVDRPGHGLSHPVDYGQVPDLRRHAAAFMSRVLDLLGLQRATLVGNSMGGFFALSFALAHPERVDHLVLVGAPAGTHRSLPARLRALATPGLGPLLWRTVARPTEAHMRPFFESLLVSDPAQLDDTYLACAVAGLQLPGSDVALLSLLRRFASPTGTRPEHDLREALPRLTVPTLFLWGDADPYAPPDTPDLLAARMPAAEVVHVPGAGHFVWFADASRCAQAINGFVAMRRGVEQAPPAPPA